MNRIKPDNDLSRMKKEYAKRALKNEYSKAYSLFSLSYLFTIQQRERRILKILRRKGMKDLNGKNILELGCGGGVVLLDMIRYDANPARLTGVDLIFERLVHARTILPHSLLTNADGQNLPFCDDCFDLVLQYTAFSSVLDNTIKEMMAYDMLRVLKPRGIIVWYDFWLNPTNPQTRGIRMRAIRKLFPGCSLVYQKITLAPPITRCVVPLSWSLALFLESLKIFNSHYLVLIRKPNQ
jgi:ubiquinone/menaquinone biosynthesis C-methylase UbiE